MAAAAFAVCIPALFQAKVGVTLLALLGILALDRTSGVNVLMVWLDTVADDTSNENTTTDV